MLFHIQSHFLSVQSPTLWSVHSIHGVHMVAKDVKLMALQRGIRIHQYLDDWLVRATSYQTCLQHTQTLVALCRELDWLMNKEKSELDPKRVFKFIGYQIYLKEGRVRPTPDRWQSVLSSPVYPVRQFMSLIAATEKQVQLGRLHMRPIQWHLKNNWRVPESLVIVIPVPQSLDPHRWLEESNVLPGQPLHQVMHALQRRVGCSIKQVHFKWKLVRSRKPIVHKPLGIKSGLSGPKRVPRPLLQQHNTGSHR